MENTSNKKPKYNNLIIHGERYKTLYTKKFEQRKKWEKPDAKKIGSVIPSLVIDVFAKEGDTVSKNEKMVILEAMKMRNTYYYPFSGKIKCVNIKPGDKIPKGFIMLEFE